MSSTYPLSVDVDPPLRMFLLVIPLYVWSMVLGYGADAVAFVGRFAVVFTGRMPLIPQLVMLLFVEVVAGIALSWGGGPF